MKQNSIASIDRRCSNNNNNITMMTSKAPVRAMTAASPGRLALRSRASPLSRDHSRNSSSRRQVRRWVAIDPEINHQQKKKQQQPLSFLPPSPSAEEEMSLPLKELESVFEKASKEREFFQAVSETTDNIKHLLLAEEGNKYMGIFKRMIEPERVVIFRVVWIDDNNEPQVNRGYRVQFSSALGPYKGGLRFHPSVDLSILKFLAFEQTFKNALTGMALGSGKGGSDFDPKGKSDAEIMRFCQSFMTELFRHIGPHTDIPAGDIGVGEREIGYMFGQYKRLVGRFDSGTITGKGASYGGSYIRPEATGYGLIYFLQEMVTRRDLAPSLQSLRCAVSGSGNVAQYAVAKLLSLGALPVTMSDSDGTLFCPKGFTEKDLSQICHLKNTLNGRLSEFELPVEGITYIAGRKPWQIVNVDIALPCATQNELDLEDAISLVSGGLLAVAEGANMPTTPEAISHFEESGVLFGPAKAANAGGVAVSGLEMSQNAQGVLKWSREEVEERLRQIMVNIYDKCEQGGSMSSSSGNLRKGADVIGFLTVAEAMQSQGYV
jgi:glutamate dehydrogenase (NADP+)